MATSSVETLEELVTCNICLNQYDEEIRKPKFLQCSHTICLECFQATRQEDTVTCPFCRQRTLKDNGDDEEWVLPNNQYALEILKLKRNGTDPMSSTVQLSEPAEEDVDEDVMMEVVAECFMVAFAQAVSSREMEEETLNEAYYQSLLDDHQEPEVMVAEPPAIPYIEPAGEEEEEEQLMMALALSCTEM
ncbi:hypothetical protein DAPPUDRAFT_302628 [Daphnia pulex]|uniref:RING-type domain-containing protein n=1 Tax=Daphnia pulex TaxID=6669 RepID=E9GE45_DAPPU|nr:hypothetical protein DAPPUDRAFT_302628 [Daphnia pulex]|eukprot:EFX82378.1 hypothetical protein DAPPUDRAFT_302628 [Daphnia pulex]